MVGTRLAPDRLRFRTAHSSLDRHTRCFRDGRSLHISGVTRQRSRVAEALLARTDGAPRRLAFGLIALASTLALTVGVLAYAAAVTAAYQRLLVAQCERSAVRRSNGLGGQRVARAAFRGGSAGRGMGCLWWGPNLACLVPDYRFGVLGGIANARSHQAVDRIGNNLCHVGMGPAHTARWPVQGLAEDVRRVGISRSAGPRILRFGRRVAQQAGFSALLGVRLAELQSPEPHKLLGRRTGCAVRGS